MSANHPDSGKRICVLPEHVARKIAAGEVIERPQSVLRELLDNAIDAGASEINVWLTNGGNDELIIQDNGCGMDAADLALCHLPHATSKIRNEADLMAIRSLGFRGEALAAIAAVSHLEILSGTGSEQNLLRVEGGIQTALHAAASPRGTRIGVRTLFYNLPARRQFLKRASTEASLCQSVLIEKAMCFPAIQFRLHVDGTLRLNLQACTGKDAILQRAWQCHGQDMGDRALFQLVQGKRDQDQVSLLLGSPDVFRHDRRSLQVFVNHRRVQDYGLAQALEFAYTGFLPGGRFPVAFVWLDVDPASVDVNIHPAKREVKLHHHAALHHRIVELAADHLRGLALRRRVQEPATQYSLPIESPVMTLADKPLRTFPVLPEISRTMPPLYPRTALAPSPPRPAPDSHATSNLGPYTPPQEEVVGPVESEARTQGEIRYLGQIFGCFLAYTRGEELILLDMHAAHERILFERYLTSRSGQDLLLPREMEVDELAEMWLQRERHALANLGLVLEARDAGQWQLLSCPSWMLHQEALLEEFLAKPHGAAIEALRDVAAQLSCRQAVKDGDVLDAATARQIIDGAEALTDPRCPHGRPIWYRLEREELFTLIGRLV